MRYLLVVFASFSGDQYASTPLLKLYGLKEDQPDLKGIAEGKRLLLGTVISIATGKHPFLELHVFSTYL